MIRSVWNTSVADNANSRFKSKVGQNHFACSTRTKNLIESVNHCRKPKTNFKIRRLDRYPSCAIRIAISMCWFYLQFLLLLRTLRSLLPLATDIRFKCNLLALRISYGISFDKYLNIERSDKNETLKQNKNANYAHE